MPYIPKSKYKIKYTRGDELIIKETGEDYIGEYIHTSKGQKYTGTNNIVTGQILIKKTQDTRNPQGNYFKDKYVKIHNVFKTEIKNFLAKTQEIPTVKSVPTQKDYERGHYMRYFVQRINGSNYKEIDEKTHKLIINKSPKYDYNLYKCGLIRWHLTGNVFQKNTEMIKQLQKGWKGIFNLFPILNEFQLPDPLPTMNLHTDGGELYRADGSEYVGSYHIHPEIGPMVGAQHTEIEHDKLYYTHQLPNPSGINYQSFVESQLEIICYKCDNGYPVANKFQARTCPDGWTTDKNPCKITGDPSSPTNPNIGARMTNPNTPTTPSTSTGPAAPTGPTAPSPGGGGY